MEKPKPNSPPGTESDSDSEVSKLQKRIVQLEKVQKALMGRVERNSETQGGAFSLFEGNILLSNQIKKRTQELVSLNEQLGKQTDQLQLIIQALPGLVALFNDQLGLIQVFRGLGTPIPIVSKGRIDQSFDSPFKELFLSSLEQQKLQKTPQTFNFEFNHQADLRTYEGTVSSISAGLYLLYLRDTTEESRKKEIIEVQKGQIIQSSKLSSLGEMAGSIAHEINNPLAIIGALAFKIQSLLDRDPLDRPLINESLDKVQATVKRISKIVKSLRQVSRDASQDDFETCELKTVIEEVLDVCREKFASQGVQLEVQLPESQLVRCRRIPISQVVLNLLNNAYYVVKSHPQGWIKVHSENLGKRTRISIIDSGNGISPEVVAKIFQPFFTTKEIGEGTGLGLSVSKQIIQDHASSLEYELKDGHTCFFFDVENNT